MTPKPTPPATAVRLRLPPTRAQVVIGSLTLVYAAVLFWLWDSTVAGPERSWFVSANLYLPQIVWAIPGLLLFVAALLTRTRAKGRRNLWVGGTLLPLLIVFGPLMGLRGFPSPGQPAAKPDARPIRVVTYNVEFGRNPGGVLGVIQAAKPDVLMLQDTGGGVEELLRSWYPDWHIKKDTEFLVASAFPLSEFKRVELPHLPEDKWKRFSYVRAEVKFGSEKLAVYTTHLMTPRSALTAMRSRDVNAVGSMDRNNNLRVHQASIVAKAIQQESLPFVLGGDFNAPEASLTCGLVMRAGTRDAFSEAGKGYGYTFGHKLRFNESFLRIDHLFVSKHWAIQECYAGDKSGSDHRPVIATLRLAYTDSNAAR